MAEHSFAILIAEVGTAITQLTLVDLVDDVFRLIARAETWSTVRAPDANLATAVLELAATLETITGRELVRDGQLLVGGADGAGVRQLIVTTSAAGTLPVAVAALGKEQSARDATHAVRGVYTSIEHVLALDEAGVSDQGWLGREVARLAATKPAVILIAGGFDGGSPSGIERIGKVVGLLLRGREKTPHVIYAGNAAAVERARAAIGGDIPIHIVENLRPAPSRSHLEPARAALRDYYNEHYTGRVPGYAVLQGWGAGRIGTVAEDQALVVRFLAERFGRNVLALDIGATHGCYYLQSEGHFSQVVLANHGASAGSVRLLDAVGPAAIARWLPFDLAENEIRNVLLNRRLRPNIPAVDFRELLLEYALLREALGGALAALVETRASICFDLVIARGMLARAPQPGLAALALLDSLPLEREENHYAVDLYLDRLSLLPVAGALARVDADAAACLIEHDVLNNSPLATVVVPHGPIELGQHVLQAELTTTEGKTRQIEVTGGEIVRVDLPRGQCGTLRIRPAEGISIGDNTPGAEVVSDEEAIAGSRLGVIVDARPRPLVLPEESEDRVRLLWRWLKALDALPPESAITRPMWPTLPSQPEAEPNVAAPQSGQGPTGNVEAETGGAGQPQSNGHGKPEADLQPVEQPPDGDGVVVASDVSGSPAEQVESVAPAKPRRRFFRGRR
jgi:hypothetical protein